MKKRNEWITRGVLLLAVAYLIWRIGAGAHVKTQHKQIGDIKADVMEQIEKDTSIEEENEETEYPSRRTHITDAGYTTIDFDQFQQEKGVTRASISPWLVHFARKQNMTKLKHYDCTFVDVNNVDKHLMKLVKEACVYGFVKGTVGAQYMPNKNIKRYEVLTMLTRSLVGDVKEGGEKRYEGYVLKAKEIGLIKANVALETLDKVVTQKELAVWLYNADRVAKSINN